MVTQVLSLTRSGLADFVVQRVSAVILTVYTVTLLVFFLNGGVTFETLTTFFWSMPMQIFSTLALLSTLAHAWIGLWTVGTDYIRPAHVGGSATVLRFAYQILCLLVLFVYLVWGARLIWQF